jgi:single-stranded DNA-binding protein
MTGFRDHFGGRRIPDVVVGRLQQRSWTAEDGNARSTAGVVTEELGGEPTVGDGDYQDHAQPVASSTNAAGGTRNMAFRPVVSAL